METFPPKVADPTLNVRELISDSIKRVDDIANIREKHTDEKFKDYDVKYQIQFTAAKEAVGIASTAQEKLVAQALDGTKEAINKADVATDKRFELLSDQIRALAETLNTNKGAQGIYVTHTDLAVVVDKIQSGFENALEPVVAFMNSQRGRSSGFSASWGIIVGAVGLTSTVILLVLRLTGN